MGFKPMISERKYFPTYEISKEKALQIQALEFKPMLNYFTASKMSKKNLRKINKRKELRLFKEKAYNILAFIGCKPKISKTKYFPAYKISQEKDLKIQGLMAFNPMTKYFAAS